MREVKAPQPQEFGHIPLAQLAAQAAVEHLKDDIGRDFKVMERRARPLIETTPATPAKIQRIAQAGSLIKANLGSFRMTMGTLYDGGSATIPWFIG